MSTDASAVLLVQLRPDGISPKANFLGNWGQTKAKQRKEQRSQEGEAKQVPRQGVPRAEPEPGSKCLAPSHQQGPPAQAPGSITVGAPEALSVPLGILAGEVRRVGSAGQG